MQFLRMHLLRRLTTASKFMSALTKIMKLWPKRWVTTALVVLAILYLTLVPRPLPDAGVEIPGLDKVVHAVMFGGLAFVACIDAAQRRRGSFGQVARGKAWFIALLSAVFGGLVEIAQMAMGAGRSGDLLDFVADCAGAVAGMLLAARVLALLSKQNGNDSGCF